MPELFNDVGECVDAALRQIGRRVVLALPLGIGKPVAIANEFWRRARRDPTLQLTIITALSLQRPHASSGLERRLLDPLTQRVFGSFEDLDYVEALRKNSVPDNIRIIEFFLEPGAYLNAPHSQQNYLCANYTHVAREIVARGVNVIATTLAKRSVQGEIELSLGSNADVTADLLPMVEAQQIAGSKVLMVGAIHSQMPFMLGAARVAPERFDLLLEHERYDQDLFCPPNPALGTTDYAIGLHASALVRDDGTLQIGIGELGDSICYALLLRHQQSTAYQQVLRDIGTERLAATIDSIGGRTAFVNGLFGCTEMFVDQMLDLYRAGVMRRRVYDSLPLSRLIAKGNITERFDARILEDLPHVGVAPRLTQSVFEELQHFGVFRSEVRLENGRMRGAEGPWIDADLADPAARALIAAHCLGRALCNGELLHAGFFLGPRSFYASLRELPPSDRRQFNMRGVGYINQLYGDDYDLRVLQRKHARFVNTTMMVTLLGAAISDGLDDGRVVSGVGGQYNFVAMAHALPGARSILCVRATRTKDGVTRSNIVWSYGHVTIPRHLRDIVITEYGIADLRGRTDREVIAALLSITDSRFQTELLATAKAAGKITGDYVIPEIHRNNTPQQLERALSAHRAADLFSEFPFGTDLTPEEIVLARALKNLKSRTRTRWQTVREVAAAICHAPQAADQPYLKRMGLESVRGWRERVAQRLVARALRNI